jgi:hypothetical protein
MTFRKVIRHPLVLLHRRTCTRVLAHPWPFLYSVVGNELVKNLPPSQESAKKSRKKRRRVKMPTQG